MDKIQKKIIKTQILSFPGAVLLGLGLYGMFGMNSYSFLPFLQNEAVVYAFIGIGLAIEVWSLFILVPLFKQKAKTVKGNCA